MTIKVALVGLSAKPSWASSAHLPYLLSAQGRKHYQIVALLNSSVDAAKAAIEHHKLPADATAAYGDPESLAADIVAGKIEVNLVSVATRVDVHYPVVQPLLEAIAKSEKELPKDLGVYVEWPLASNLREAEELTSLAKAAGVRTAIGLQGRVAPPVLTVRDIVASGKLGRLVSTEARGHIPTDSRSAIDEKLAYFTDKTIGGNIVTIGLGHAIDSLQFALGEIDTPGSQSQSQIQFPQIDIRKAGAKQGEYTITKTVTSNVPDQITVLGSLKKKDGPASQYFSDGTATVLVRFSRGAPYPGDAAFVWIVQGTKGELRLEAPASPYIQAFGGGNNNQGPTQIKLTLHDYATNKVTEAPWTWQDWQSAEESVPARNIGGVYEAYAAGKDSEYASFADAQVRHEQIERWLNEFYEKQ